MNSLDYEREKYKVFQNTIKAYKEQLNLDRDIALDMPIETDNGFNVERETLITDIDDKLEILKKHSEDPYFAKLLFTDLDDGTEFNGYIGRLSIGEISDPSDNKIVDWRAPISDLYYNGRLGTSSYKSLDKDYQVDLKLKRQIKVKNHSVEAIYDLEDKISNDEFLIPYLTQSADNRLKNIVATIQSEQNDIIRCSPFENIVVQGVAGSGKTTVALHRLSYIIYNYKKRLFPADLLIISPNEIFLNYISSILIDLEADKANSFCLNKILSNMLGENITLESKHYQYDKLKKLGLSTNYLSYKNSSEFAKVIEKFIDQYIKDITYKPLMIKGIKVLDSEDVYFFFKSPEKDKIVERIFEDGSKRLGLALSTNTKFRQKALENISKSDKDFMIKNYVLNLLESGNYGYILKMFKTKFDVFKIYALFIKDIEKFTDYEEVDILKKQTLDNLKHKTLTYDDFAPIIYLATRFFEFPFYNRIRCVFIDEAQDFSELMFIALKKLFKFANFSIFGDIAQGIYSYESIKNWDFVVGNFKDSKMLFLNRSYRTSVEIMIEANKELNKLGLPPANNVVRHGEEVEFENNNDVSIISKQLKILNSKYNTTAIICKDDFELKTASEKLSDLHLKVVSEDNAYYGDEKNLLLTIQTAKGLEFDSVIIYDKNSYSENDIDLKQLYVAKTRALHKLVICKSEK